MSKILYPFFRLRYVVAPEQLIDSLVKIRSTMDQHSSAIDQATLARFINEGFFLSHIKRMRKLYAERREFFMKEFNKLLGDRFTLQIPEAGLNFVAWLRCETDLARVARVCTRHRNQTLTAIILLHRDEAQARVCFRFCCLDARANSRKPPKACLCTQITTRP
jgi:GntR family transcriptional regulator/MocR family aminotransferase